MITVSSPTPIYSAKFLAIFTKRIMPLVYILLAGSHTAAQALAAADDRLDVYCNMTTIELAPGQLDVMVEEEVWVACETGRTPRTRELLAPMLDSSILEEARAGD